MAVMWMNTDDRDPRDLMPVPTERGLRDLEPNLTERRQAATEKALTTALIAAQEEMASAAMLDAIIHTAERDGYYRRARALVAIAVDFTADDQD